MGVVFHGFDPVIGRDVAVKTLRLSEAGTGMSREELVGRFQTEARAAGLLTHPNIVVIFDAGEEDGLFYITMEFVEGKSLQSQMDLHQPFPLPRVMKLMEQVCSALDFAHQHNVVHRDIKPANLMLTSDDTVKITDFGTAKSCNSALRRRRTSWERLLTCRLSRSKASPWTAAPTSFPLA
jgi:serine/threonine-protein kinase